MPLGVRLALIGLAVWLAGKLSAEIEYLTKQAGLSLEELLGGLREQRARYHADRLERL